MGVNAQIMHINDFLFLLNIPKQNQVRTWSLTSGQVFPYNNRTKNPIPVLATGYLMEFPGSLHPLACVFVECNAQNSGKWSQQQHKTSLNQLLVQLVQLLVTGEPTLLE